MLPSRLSINKDGFPFASLSEEMRKSFYLKYVITTKSNKHTADMEKAIWQKKKNYNLEMVRPISY